MKKFTPKTSPLFFLLFLCYSLQAQWVEKNNGLYGGSIQALVTKGTSLFAGTVSGGVFRSVDNGSSWTLVNPSLRVESFAVSGSSLFAGTYGGGVFRSTDDGSSWTRVNNGLTHQYVRSLAVSGANLFAGTDGGGVFLSTDNGSNWTEVNFGLTYQHLRSLAVNGPNLFAGTDGEGVFLSTNNGSNWIEVNNGLTSQDINAFVVSGSNLFAGTVDGIFMSNDNGSNWIEVSNGLTNQYIYGLAVNGSNLFASTDGGGVFRSVDNGSNWTTINNGLMNQTVDSFAIIGTNLFAATYGGGVFRSADNGSNWTAVNNGVTNQSVASLAVSGSNLFAATYGGGIFRSGDIGSSWTAANNGLTNTYTSSIAVSGSNLFAGTYNGGVFRSIDNGSNWAAINNGLTDPNITSLTVSGSNLFAGTEEGGVFRSIDNGSNWTAVNNGLTTQDINTLAVSGSNLFAGTSGGGVFRSIDNGSNWTAVNNGLTSQYIYAFAVSGSNLFAGTDYGVFLSNDNGSNWTELNNDFTGTGVSVLTVSGSNLFAGTNSGVFLTTNNGSNWRAVNNGLKNTYVLSFAVSGSNVFVGTDGGGVWSRPLSDFQPGTNQLNNSPSVLLSAKQIKSQDSESWSSISDIAFDASGSLVLTGYFEGTVDFDPGVSQHLLTTELDDEQDYVAKYNPDGSMAWAYMLDNSDYDNYISYEAIATDAGGTIYLAGGLEGTSDVDPGPGVTPLTTSGGSDTREPVFSKVNAAGNLIWAKQLSFSGSGYGYNADIESITIDKDNNILVMGTFDPGQLDVDPGLGVTELINTGSDYIDNVFIAKYDNNGNYLWSAKRVYEESNDYDSYAIMLVTDSQNNVYLTYSVSEYINYEESYQVVEKYSSSGSLLWSVKNQNVSGDFRPLKLDESNNRLYVLGDTEDSQQTPVFNGTSGSGTLSSSSENGNSGYVAIYDLNGAFINVLGFGSSGESAPLSLNLLSNGNLLISGWYEGSIDMDPSSGTSEQFNNEASFITEITPSGDFISGASIPNSEGMLSYINSQGELVGLLLFEGTADIDLGTGANNLTAIGEDMAILKYSLQGAIAGADRSALEAFFNSTGGPNWTVKSNWLSGSPANWFGVTVTGGKITAINLPDNNLTGSVPNDITVLDDLTTINISGNKIASLADLSAMAGITSLNVANNKLDFSSLQPNVAISGILYAPQDSVETKESTLKQVNEQINFTATIGGTGNNYQWKKDGTNIAGATNSTLTITGIAFKDDGVYHYSATNPGVPGLTLLSQTKTLRVSSLQRDSVALRLLYNSTNGPDWTNDTNWLTTPLGTGNWFGVTIGNNRVTGLNLSNNNLVGSVPEAVADIQNLSLLNLSSNKIEHLPNLKPLSNITVLDVSKNQLDFASLIANSSVAGVNYMNQADIGIASTELVDYGTDYPLVVSSKGEGNHYQWKRNGADVAGATDSIYTIKAINRSNMGEYVSVITNPAVPDLVLKTAPKKVLATAILSGKFSIADGSGVSNGKIRLLLVKPSSGYDTIAVKDFNQDGSFRFEKVILDNYQISGFADTLTYTGALPTYYKSTVYWEEGDTLFVDGNRNDLNFESVFKPKGVPKGVGIISGYLEEPEIPGGRDESAKRVSGAGASVRSVANTARPLGEKLTLVAYVFTNDLGEFELPELPNGDYRLNIQYPGYPMDQASYINITIGDGLESQTRVAASVENNKIKVVKLVITGVWEKEGINVQVYPNPSADHVVVRFNEASATRSVELVNMLSVKLTSQAATQKENSLNVRQYPAGMYLLLVKERGEVIKTVRIAIE